MYLPAFLFAQVSLPGNQVASLSMVASHWQTEGSCIVEVVDAQRKAATAVANGIWRKESGSLDACVLELECDDPGVEGWPELLDQLMAEAVKHGGAWGLDSFAKQGGG